MAWKIVDGQPQRTGGPEVRIAVVSPGIKSPSLPPAEIELVCPYCGKQYKTERGLNTHLTTH